MRLKVLIADDEPLARQGLRMMVSGEPRVTAISEARNGRETVASIRDDRPDLVLLDVQMPRMDGFGVVAAVGAERMPNVIFVTAHDQYAVRAFEISAVDYLLKPVTAERFRTAFARATHRLRDSRGDDDSQQMLTMLEAIARPPRRIARFAVRAGERTLFVPVDAVDRIEAAQNYVQLFAGPTKHLLHVPMSAIEAALDPDTFVRIHRSHIVNVRRIRQVWSHAPGRYLVELASGDRLPSGRTYGDRIRTLLHPF